MPEYFNWKLYRCVLRKCCHLDAAVNARMLLVHHYVSWNLQLSNRGMWNLSVHSTWPSKIKTDWYNIVIHCILYVLLQYQLSDIINAVKIFISVLSFILLGLMTQYLLTPSPILVCGGFIYVVTGVFFLRKIHIMGMLIGKYITDCWSLFQ